MSRARRAVLPQQHAHRTRLLLPAIDDRVSHVRKRSNQTVIRSKQGVNVIEK
jgi:hypothetical protein